MNGANLPVFSLEVNGASPLFVELVTTIQKWSKMNGKRENFKYV